MLSVQNVVTYQKKKCAKCSGIYFTDTLAGNDLQTPYKVFFDG